MRLFISYARVDRLYCLQIVDLLDVHETWHDSRLYAGQNWWKEILRWLDWCEGFVYLLSPESVASEYCRKEYDLAVSMGRPIIPVLIHEDVELPEELAHIQHVDLSKGITPEGVRMLLNSVHLAERRALSQPSRPSAVISSEDLKPPTPDQAHVISAAAEAMEKSQFDRAVFLLKQAKENNFTSRYIDIDVMLKEALIGLEQQSMLRAAEREYRQIAELMKYNRTRRLGCQAFAAFRREFPDFDPDGIGAICQQMANSLPDGVGSTMTGRSQPSRATSSGNGGEPTVSRPGRVGRTVEQISPEPGSESIAPAAELKTSEIGVVQPAQEGTPPAEMYSRSLPEPAPEEFPGEGFVPQPVPAEPERFKLRLLEWCEVLEGPVHMTDNSSQNGSSVIVPGFSISKYLVTNEQYQAFLDDPNGYANPMWWDFSPHAQEWRSGDALPKLSKFQGNERPREMVNWFDAMAFCNWLSDRMEAKIGLPTVRQWVRAARGEELWTFPWGDKFDEERCNTSHSKLKMTSPVNRYPNGTSPFGVYDMAGNVWEWCLNPKGDDGDTPEIVSDLERAVHGGSYIGPAQRASVTFQYYLSPRLYYSSIGFRIVKLS